MDLYFDIHFGILYNKSIVFPRKTISFRKDRHFAIGEVERMAKEAMQAVSRAEQAALETVQQAKEEADRLRREAATQGEQLVAAAVKEARKRADVLCGVARADGKKRQEALLQESRKEQEQLREQAAARQGQVARELERLVLGQPRRR